MMKTQKRRAAPKDKLNLGNVRVGIVAARFNSFVVDRLVDGARAVLTEHGVEEDAIVLLHVPGAFELPLAAQELAAGHEVDAIVALGAVIRGDTAHFDYVCSECASGLMRISLDHGVPVGFGVLMVDNENQALARAGEEDNKGREAAQAAVEMIDLLQRVRQ